MDDTTKEEEGKGEDVVRGGGGGGGSGARWYATAAFWREAAGMLAQAYLAFWGFWCCWAYFFVAFWWHILNPRTLGLSLFGLGWLAMVFAILPLASFSLFGCVACCRYMIRKRRAAEAAEAAAAAAAPKQLTAIMSRYAWFLLGPAPVSQYMYVSIRWSWYPISKAPVRSATLSVFVAHGIQRVPFLEAKQPSAHPLPKWVPGRYLQRVNIYTQRSRSDFLRILCPNRYYTDYS